MGKQFVELGTVSREQVILADSIKHPRRVCAPVRIAVNAAVKLLVVPIDDPQLLGGKLWVATQPVEHVVHVNGLIHGPGSPSLLISKI